MEKEEERAMEEWGNYRDDEIMNQHSAIRAEQANNLPFVADKEPLSALAAEYESGSPILLQKIELLGEQFSAIRRTRGDGNCFFRSFMLSYLERILQTQDLPEIDRVKSNVEDCRKTLQTLGYADFTFEDFFSLFLEQLDSVIQVTGTSISHGELVERSRDQSISDYVVMFLRFVTSGEIRKRSDFFEPFTPNPMSSETTAEESQTSETTMQDSTVTQPQDQQSADALSQKLDKMKISPSFSIWPPTQRTRDAVTTRLIETLSTPSVLSKRYGTVSPEDASAIAISIEEEAFSAASAVAASTAPGGAIEDSIDGGIEILQVYSKEISKRVLDAVKSRSAAASGDGSDVAEAAATADVGSSQGDVVPPSEEVSSADNESSSA